MAGGQDIATLQALENRFEEHLCRQRCPGALSEDSGALRFSKHQALRRAGHVEQVSCFPGASAMLQACCGLAWRFLCLLLVAFVPPARGHLRLADAVPVPRNLGSPDRLEAALQAMGAPRPPSEHLDVSKPPRSCTLALRGHPGEGWGLAPKSPAWLQSPKHAALGAPH